MQHDAKERNKWKVRIADCINQSTSLASRPVRKVMAEVVAGILGSGSLQMSEVGRCLKEQPDTPLSMIVVRHGKQQPLVLVSTQRVRGRLQGERLIQAYISRWAVEEGFRFSKQGFDLEKVQARKLSTLQNLVALATLAWVLLADHQHQGNILIDKAKRQKDHTLLTFPFYTLLAGWQELFAHATTLLYDWWRKPKPKDPPIIADLFQNAGGLSPC